MQWKRARGYDSRRLDFTAKHGSFTFKVTRYERLDGRFLLSPFWHAYIDNDYLGYSQTADGAKLICVLNAMELQQ